MPDFQHLNLIRVIARQPFVPSRGGSKKGPETRYNLNHRQEHFDALTSQIAATKTAWVQNLEDSKRLGLADITNTNQIPVFLKIDSGAKDVESLKSFGIDIISQEEDGFIVGANSDGFKLFSDRLDQFLNESNKKFKDSAASLLEVFPEPTERLKRIIQPSLLSKWEQLEEFEEVVIYVAISSYLKIPDYPTKKQEQSEESYLVSVANWRTRYEKWEIAKDDLAMTRQTALEEFIKPYNAVFVGTTSQYTDFDDGFGCKIRISGKGLKDLGLRFPFIFNIEEHDPLFSYHGTTELENIFDLEILEPGEGSPTVCVIDSGIQERHRLLASAIDGSKSISYVPNDTDTFDKVSNGGHGTRVAGVILFPLGINNYAPAVRAPFWLQNARILDEDNTISSLVNEAELMKIIVDKFTPTKIFNLSIACKRPELHVHMPIWSASLDRVIWHNDVLFCIAAGNIPVDSNNTEIPGILNFLQDGLTYPGYLQNIKARIVNPALSCFAITVGSISPSEFEDGFYKSIAHKNEPSSFSRSGLGLWGMIKPDVVEYGGDFALEKSTGSSIILHEELSPNLLRSTRDNGPAVGRDAVGTSFAAPKVTHIAASIQALYPTESSLLYRALIIQSARIPREAENIPDFINNYGYGIPDLSRATTNSEKRVTLYNSGFINPKHSNIYLIKVPHELRRPGYDFDVLIEITLSYKAEPRITRQKTNSYLSVWLDWETSRKGESQQAFTERVLKAQASADLNEDEDDDIDEFEDAEVFDITTASFNWKIGSKKTDGEIKGVKRQDSSVQKDWCIQKSNALPEEFLVAVKGHKGWEKDIEKEIPYSIVVSFELLTGEINIYNLIRIENQIEIESEQQLEVDIRF